MNCPECQRLLEELENREEVYFDALERAGTDTERVNPNHYFHLRQAILDARIGVDLVVEHFQKHQVQHAVVR